jgi:hypothetical protein
MTLKGYWVRDLLQVWHKARERVAADIQGEVYLVRCLNSGIDVDKVGLPGAGAQICNSCMDLVEREERDR